jgi:hypothetical protein
MALDTPFKRALSCHCRLASFCNGSRWISDRDDAAYWDVSSDGQKFLFAAQPAASAAAPAETFTVVLNWTALLKK